jgi:hypothetical protein
VRKSLKQNELGTPKIIIEPEIFVGGKKPRSLFTDKEYRALLKHYQNIMFDQYLEGVKEHLG